MNQTRTFIAAVLASACLAGCSGNASYQSRYAAEDFGMGYLETTPGQDAGVQMSARISDELKLFDASFAKLSALTAPLPGPVAGQVKGYVGEVKKIVDGAIKPKLLAAVKSDTDELAKFLGAHNLFAQKDHPYGYNLIARLEGTDADTTDANVLIDEANAVLKDAYKVAASIALAQKLVEVTKADLAGLKAAPSRAKVAGIGLITVSVTRNTVSSLSQAQTLLPRLQGVFEKTKGTLMAKPMLGMKLGNLPGQLGSATAGLAGVVKDGPGLLGGLVGLAQEIASVK